MIALSSVLLSGCIPISPEAAARQCEERARAATGLTGVIDAGFDQDGPAIGDWEVGITSDALLGRDPYEVYDSCVREKTGQGPIRPPDLEP